MNRVSARDRGERRARAEAMLDVTDEASVERAVGEAARTTGLDVVVNNAGVRSFGLLESFTPEQLARIHDVNVIGAAPEGTRRRARRTLIVPVPGDMLQS